MKKKQLKYLNHLLNGSCPRIFPHPRNNSAGGPPSSATRSCKTLLLLSLINSMVILASIVSNMFVSNVSALTYSENVDVNFTFEPSINMSLSYGDLIIEDLVPGSYSDSNIITVSVSTNNIYGYNLTATAGNGSTYTSTDLIHNNSTNGNGNSNSNNNATNASFTSLSPSTSIPSMSDASPNEWGYSYSTDNGSSWSYYSGLPYYTSPGSLLALSNTNGESSVKFKIGAKADNWQMAGEYNNVINFYAITNSTPSAPGNCLNTATCMQTMTECPTAPTTVTDARDGSTYKIQRLVDGNCWMLDNLALDLTNSDVQANMLSTVDTMTNATYEQLNYLFNGGGTTTDQWPTEKLNYQPWTSSSQNLFSVPMIAVSGICANTSQCVNDPTEGQWNKNSVATSYGVGSGKIGIYYNYCAASAGTYCWGNGTSGTGSPSTDPKPGTLVDIDGDVCPANWRMPTSSDNGDYRTLCSAIKGSDCAAGDIQATSMDATSSSSMQHQLSITLSGRFYSGSSNDQGLSIYLWSSTWNDTRYMYYFDADSSRVFPSFYDYRTSGRPVRCLLK